MVAAPVKKKVSEPSDNPLSSDIWDNDKCNVCSEVCTSKESKLAHCKTPRHMKKTAISKFYTQEVTTVTSSKRPSLMLERYRNSGEQAIGLESMHELVFPFAESGWWACSICHDAGYNYDQVDEHLESAEHLHTYMEEFYPRKAKSIERGWSFSEKWEYLLAKRREVYEEQLADNAELIAPEVIELNYTLEEARKKLLVDDKTRDYSLLAIPNDGNNIILQCLICHEVVAIRKENPLAAWALHQSTDKHKRFCKIASIVRQFTWERVLEEDRIIDELAEDGLRWKHVDGRVYGPICGIKYLRAMGRSDMCDLCGCICDNVDEHFASEEHLLRFVCTQSPLDSWQMLQESQETRREHLLAKLEKMPQRENEESRRTKDSMPSMLKEVAVKGATEYVPCFPPPLEPFGMDGTFCVTCPSCWMALPVSKEKEATEVWDEHVHSDQHLDFAARRVTMEYDASFFVPMASSITLLPMSAHGQWEDRTVNGVGWRIQTQTDVGLEYIVEDAESGMAVCTLCARSYPLGKACHMPLHVRSHSHLIQYMHCTARPMLAMVLESKIDRANEELMIEWLQRSKVSEVTSISVFNKKKALELAEWPNVSFRSMSVSALLNEERHVFESVLSMVDTVAQDEDASRTMTAREALQTCGLKIIGTSMVNKNRVALLRCSACEACLVARIDCLAEDIWEKHVGSEEHHRRVKAFAANQFSPLYFSPLSSTYTVKPFLQKDPAKKVTWRWNARDGCHDLVLSVIGLDELVEKRSDEKMLQTQLNEEDFTPHFFCRVCAIDVGKRAQVLEDHVRSYSHVIAYVNKHHPQTILDLERLTGNDEGKERRKILANLLKDVGPPTEYCIAVYDPIGECERRQKESEIKQRQRETAKKMEEARSKAVEERKRKDEERRKLKEEEAKRARERDEERRKEQQILQEKTAAMAAERERLRKLAMSKAALADFQKQKEMMDLKKTQIVANDPGIKALLEKKQELAAQLEKLRAQTKQSIPEPKLVIPGRNMLASVPPQSLPQPTPLPLHQNTPILPLPTSISSFVQNTSVPPPSMTMGYPAFTPSIPPPLIGPGSMSIPPPSLTVPPPGMLGTGAMGMGCSVMDMVGPKPVLNTYVPKVDAMPVYPSHIKRDRTPSPSGARGWPRRLADFERPSLAGAQPDMYVTNPQIIQSRAMLVEYMWRQGTELAPEEERPARFSRLCAATIGVLGMEYLYEVVCVDSADLTTMYCSMCSYWSTPTDMLKHMTTSSHRIAYLFRNYKLYHKTVEDETDLVNREVLLEQFAKQIQLRDKPPPVIQSRLKCYLNAATIQRLWPQYVTVLDQSWRKLPECRTPSPPRPSSNLRRGSSRSRSYSRDRDDSRSYSRSRSRSRSPDRNGRRGRSRSRDRRRRRNDSRDRGRSRSRSPSHRRKRSRSRSRSRSPEPMKRDKWEPPTFEPMRAAGASAAPAQPDFGGVPPPQPTGVPPPSYGVLKELSQRPEVGGESPMIIDLSPPDTPSKKDEKQRDRESRGKDRDRSRSDKSKGDDPRDAQREKAMERAKEMTKMKESERKAKDREIEKEKEREMEKRRRERKEEEERRRRERRERSHERRGRRSPSPSRKRRRSRSSSRDRRDSSSHHHRSSGGISIGALGGAAPKEDWEIQTAAFLAKIGNLQDAVVKPSTASPQVQPLTPVAAPSAADRVVTPTPAYEPIYDESASRAAAPAATRARIPDDPESSKRKLLGVLVALQQEAERGTQMTQRDIEKIYEEVGLTERGENTQDMLKQLIDMVGGQPSTAAAKPSINLQDFGIGVSSPGQPHQPSHGASPYGASARAPPAGYADPYARSPRDAPPPQRGAPQRIPSDIEDMLLSIKNQLDSIRRGPPLAAARPPPPSAYDRRDPYGPTSSYMYEGDRRPDPRDPRAYDPRGPAPLPSRPPGGYHDPRMDPRSDPRMLARYEDLRGDPRASAPLPPGLDPRDPRARYYDDPYGRAPAPAPAARPPTSAYDTRDPRDAYRDPRADPRMDPRMGVPPSASADPRDQRAAAMAAYDRSLQPQSRSMEYEGRRPMPPDYGRPNGGVAAGATPPVQQQQPQQQQPPQQQQRAPAPVAKAPAAPPAANRVIEEITIDDDWDSLEEMFDGKSTTAAAPTPASKAAPAAPPAAQPSQQPAAPSAADSPDARQIAHQERMEKIRQQWAVRNKATPPAQPHLAAAAQAHAAPKAPAPAAGQDYYGAASAIATGGQWNSGQPQQQQQHYAQQPPAHLPPRPQQQQPQGYYDQSGQYRAYPPNYGSQPGYGSGQYY